MNKIWNWLKKYWKDLILELFIAGSIIMIIVGAYHLIFSFILTSTLTFALAAERLPEYSDKIGLVSRAFHLYLQLTLFGLSCFFFLTLVKKIRRFIKHGKDN